jgi:hypothetical protein
MRKILISLFLVIFSAGFLTADVYVKQLNHTDAINMMGQEQPATDDIMHLWFAKNKMAMHGVEQSFIYDMDAGKVYMLYHDQKAYVEMDLPLDISKYVPEEAAPMLKMMGDIVVTVKPTGEKQKVKEWDCEGFDVTMQVMMMTFRMKIWSSKDVPIEWGDYVDKVMQMSNPAMPLGEKAIAEFKKIEGYPIRTEMTMNMMGNDIKSYQEVLEITKKSAPAGTYSLPEGYTKQDKISFDMFKR